MARRMSEVADAILFNPFLYLALRRHGIYTWGIALRVAGFLLIAGGAVVRFACARIDIALADRVHPSLRQGLRMERMWDDFTPFESVAMFLQVVGVAVMLAPLALALGRDLLRLPGLLLGFRPKPLLPDDLRVAPLTTRQAIACQDAPFLLTLLALIPASALALLPCRLGHPGLEVFATWRFDFPREHVGSEYDSVLPVFVVWVAAFTVHRILQMLFRARFRPAIRSRWGALMLGGILYIGAAGVWVHDFARRVDQYEHRVDQARHPPMESIAALGSGPLPLELHGPRLLLIAACACWLLACHEGVEWIRRAEEDREA